MGKRERHRLLEQDYKLIAAELLVHCLIHEVLPLRAINNALPVEPTLEQK